MKVPFDPEDYQSILEARERMRIVAAKHDLAWHRQRMLGLYSVSALGAFACVGAFYIENYFCVGSTIAGSMFAFMMATAHHGHYRNYKKLIRNTPEELNRLITK